MHVTLGRQLEQLREKRGLTREETARRASLNSATLSRVEGGDGSYESATAIARGLGARVEVLGFIHDRKRDTRHLAELTGLAPETVIRALYFLASPANAAADSNLATLERILEAVGGRFSLRVR